MMSIKNRKVSEKSTSSMHHDTLDQNLNHPSVSNDIQYFSQNQLTTTPKSKHGNVLLLLLDNKELVQRID